MKHVYTKAIVIFFLSSATMVFAQGKILRSSLSTSVSEAHNIQKGQYKVQQSIGHMGIMSTINHDQRAVTRGFLLPQLGKVSTETPSADFNLVVYPNPFTTYVNIDFNAPVTGDMVIRLHDILGQLIIEKEVTAKQQQRFYLGHLAQAEYVLNVEVMGKTFNQVLLNYKTPTEE